MKVEISLDEYINSIINKSIVITLIKANTDYALPKGSIPNIIDNVMRELQPLINDTKNKYNNKIPRPKL